MHPTYSSRLGQMRTGEPDRARRTVSEGSERRRRETEDNDASASPAFWVRAAPATIGAQTKVDDGPSVDQSWRRCIGHGERAVKSTAQILKEAVSAVRVVLAPFSGLQGGYCETDVVNTYRVWLVYELFRGTLSRPEFDASEVKLLEFMRERGQRQTAPAGSANGISSPEPRLPPATWPLERPSANGPSA
jgi:Predicted 3'-5' exonuclease related to the exonuclease domain of PolB